MNNLNMLLPRHKADYEYVQKLCDLGYPAIAPILPELLEWVQDGNWPIADSVATLLVSVGEPLVPEIRRVLQTNDMMWKYWVLKRLVAYSPEMQEALKPELVQLATAPAWDEDDAEVRQAARDLLTLEEPCLRKL